MRVRQARDEVEHEVLVHLHLRVGELAQLLLALLDVLLLEHGVEQRVERLLHAHDDERLALAHAELDNVLELGVGQRRHGVLGQLLALLGA